jgi:outer membrane protein TolC
VLTAQAALVQARSNQAQALTNLKLQEKTLEYATGSLVHQEDGSRK